MDNNLITDTIHYIGNTFGGSGLLIAYFIAKDYLVYKKNLEKKESGTWVEMKETEVKIDNGFRDIGNKIENGLKSIRGCGFVAEKFMEVEDKQTNILTQLLYQQKENGSSLNRIEGKLDRNHQ